MNSKTTVAALAFVAAVSISAGYAADDQSTKMAPAPVASAPAGDDIKVAPQPSRSVRPEAAKVAPQPADSSKPGEAAADKGNGGAATQNQQTN